MHVVSVVCGLFFGATGRHDNSVHVRLLEKRGSGSGFRGDFSFFCGEYPSGRVSTNSQLSR